MSKKALRETDNQEICRENAGHRIAHGSVHSALGISTTIMPMSFGSGAKQICHDLSPCNPSGGPAAAREIPMWPSGQPLHFSMFSALLAACRKLPQAAGY